MMFQPLLLETTTSAPAGGLWVLLLPVLLGLVAVYCFIPRPRNQPVMGAAAAALALLTGGWLLLRHDVFNASTLLFYAFSGIAVIAGGLLITHRHPVRAALSFALVVLSTCGLFLLQAAPFLMAATIIVYAGAIIVTFLFVIMLAQQAGTSDADFRSREPAFSCIAGFVLLGALLYVLHLNYGASAPSAHSGILDIKAFDDLLARTRVAAQKTTVEEVGEALNDENFLAEYRRLAQPARGSPGGRELLALVEEGRHHWTALKTQGRVATMTNALSHMVQLGNRLRRARDAQGRARLPAENVLYLGHDLFTSYLLPIELGGTLLLVATIGAIAITGRKAEELR
jgi:NADH:ubiquinone oxidoreductase subunit 6 (subunit J)